MVEEEEEVGGHKGVVVVVEEEVEVGDQKAVAVAASGAGDGYQSAVQV